MPITYSAKKALRRDQRRQGNNLELKRRVSAALRLAKKKPTPKLMGEAFSLLDRAVKKKYFHQNKADRLKSRLAKLARNKPQTPRSPKKKK